MQRNFIHNLFFIFFFIQRNFIHNLFFIFFYSAILFIIYFSFFLFSAILFIIYFSFFLFSAILFIIYFSFFLFYFYKKLHETGSSRGSIEPYAPIRLSAFSYKKTRWTNKLI